MRINAINNTNYQNNNSLKPSFKSVLPYVTYINGKIVTNKSNIQRVVWPFLSIISSFTDGSEKAMATIWELQKHVKDFNYGNAVKNKDTAIRNRIESNSSSFLFFNTQAEKLDELGRQIGPEKRKGLESIFETTDTFESDEKVQAYFQQLNSFRDNKNLRVKVGNKEYILCIYARTEETFNPKKVNIVFDHVEFKPIDQVFPQQQP